MSTVNSNTKACPVCNLDIKSCDLYRHYHNHFCGKGKCIPNLRYCLKKEQIQTEKVTCKSHDTHVMGGINS